MPGYARTGRRVARDLDTPAHGARERLIANARRLHKQTDLSICATDSNVLAR